MHIRRNRRFPRALATALICASFGGRAWPADDVFRALEIERRHAVHFALGPTSLAHGVVINQWTRPVELEPIYSNGTRRNLAAQTESALRNLDERLAALAAGRAHILELIAFVEGGGQDSRVVLNMISDYLHDRASSSAGAREYHSRALHEVFEVIAVGQPRNTKATVMLLPIILDPRTATLDQRTNPVWVHQGRAERRFLIGPVHGEDALHAVSHDDAHGRAVFQLAIEDVRKLVAEVAATPGDVDEWTIYFDPSTGIAEADLRLVLDEFLPTGVPLVDYVSPRVHFVAARPVSAASGPVAIRASGSVTHYR